MAPYTVLPTTGTSSRSARVMRKKGQARLAQLAVVKAHGQEHAAQAAEAPDQLALVEAGEGEARFHPRAAGGIEVAHAHQIQQEHAGQQAPVKIAEQAFVHAASVVSPSAARRAARGAEAGPRRSRAEQKIIDLTGYGAGHAGTAAAVLHHDDDHIGLAVLDAPGGYPGVVTLGVLHFRAFQAAVAGGHFEFDHLGRAGLAAHVRILAAHNFGCAAAGGAAHGLHHKFEVLRLGRNTPAPLREMRHPAAGA